MRVVSFMRSATGLVVYDEAGRYQTLSPDDYRLGDIIESLGVLVRTGEAVEIDLRQFRILEALAEIAPAAEIVRETDEKLALRFDDLDLTIRDVGRLEQHIRSLARSERGVAAMRAFLSLASQAKRLHAVDELLDFMRAHDLAICDDGHVLAYKAVLANPDRESRPDVDYVDVHTETFDNSPCTLVRMDEKDVNPDRYTDCSYGLHVGAFEYVGRYFPGRPALFVKVNPAHFIAVPHADRYTKARVCAYLTIEELASPRAAQIERLRRLPVGVDLAGEAVEMTGSLEGVDKDVAALARRIMDRAGRKAEPTKPVEEQPQRPRSGTARKAAPARRATRGNPPSPTAKKSAPAGKEKAAAAARRGLGWHSFDELAALAASTAKAVRAAASREKWARRLDKDGLIRVQPSPAFHDRRIARWARPTEIAERCGLTAQRIGVFAKTNSWPHRKVGRLIQVQPPKGWRP